MSHALFARLLVWYWSLPLPLMKWFSYNFSSSLVRTIDFPFFVFFPTIIHCFNFWFDFIYYTLTWPNESKIISLNIIRKKNILCDIYCTPIQPRPGVACAVWRGDATSLDHISDDKRALNLLWGWPSVTDWRAAKQSQPLIHLFITTCPIDEMLSPLPSCASTHLHKLSSA